MDRLADVKAAQVDENLLGNAVGGAEEFNLVTDDVEDATRFQPGDASSFRKCTGTSTRMRASLPSPKEIDVDDEIAHRLELDIPRDHANRLAAEVEIDQGCSEAAGAHMGEKIAVFQRNKSGILLVAVDNGRNQAFAAHGPGGPLALPSTRLGLNKTALAMAELLKFVLINQMEPSGSILASAGLPPGVTGARGGAYKMSGR